MTLDDPRLLAWLAEPWRGIQVTHFSTALNPLKYRVRLAFKVEGADENDEWSYATGESVDLAEAIEAAYYCPWSGMPREPAPTNGHDSGNGAER